MSNDFMHELAIEDIESNLMRSYKTQKDGVAEMSNRSIINNANTIIKWGNSPKSFWVSKM